MLQHNDHCYKFWNAPLSQRTSWANIQLAKVTARLSVGGYPSADAYYADKNEALRLRAGIVNKQPYEVDPMAFWFQQSN